MSKKDKLLTKFLGRPKNLTWDEYVAVFKAYGFELNNGKGSKRRFYNADKLVFNIHEPHPEKTMKPYTIDEAIDFLTENDFI